ncbi:MAG: hypothetical protein JXA60_10500 [Candidatus Coatesbacteria bacterium]|nr:hypothetical protein [Candidatus Coatesbacteria bacterium]
MKNISYPVSLKPYTRWWWFASEIKENDIRYQLEWARNNNFGGVEIAWIYGLKSSKKTPVFLSREWSEKVLYAKTYAKKLGLGCDFTFGSAWPFGGTFLEKEYSAMTFNGLSEQRLEKSWEEPLKGYILNHLDKKAFDRYALEINDALKESLKLSKSALFCDSFEVETEGMWTKSFSETFKDRFGYSIEEYMPLINYHPDERFDYRLLISDMLLDEFFKPFCDNCKKMKAFSRLQAHGAPADILTAYSFADIPESEAILFDPTFSQIASSAAVLTSKKIVSAEAFTCIYGWKPKPGPSPHQMEEEIGDLKILADALFANGINFFIWHGMPYNKKNGRNYFYATVHVGESGALSKHFNVFNSYLENISSKMTDGITYSQTGVYLPLEDNWMLNELPDNMKKISAKYYWELQHLKFPEELYGYQPIWLTDPFLKNAEVENGIMKIGDCSFKLLYVYSEWMTIEVLNNIKRLTDKGLTIIFKRKPKQAGRIKSKCFDEYLGKIFNIKNMHNDMVEAGLRPLLACNEKIEFRCRKIDSELLFFIANPVSKTLSYPMRYRQFEDGFAGEIEITIFNGSNPVNTKLDFSRNSSFLLHISKSCKIKQEKLDIDY